MLCLDGKEEKKNGAAKRTQNHFFTELPKAVPGSHPHPPHISCSDSDLVRKTFRNFRGDLKQYRSTVYEMQI